MEGVDHRIVISQLADQFSWLEDHWRDSEQAPPKVLRLRFGAALVRNVIGPWIDGQGALPLHIAVVGGAGTGKSTVVNFLLGGMIAEANPQAGYTRHPIGYIGQQGPSTWAGHLGFLGPLRKLDTVAPANLDEDVYQIRQTSTMDTGMTDFVVWDCPDMTTSAAGGYLLRLYEVTALADLVIFVASDERYNDEVPTDFLGQMLAAGKQVLVVLTKMRPNQVDTLREHFRQEVLQRRANSSEHAGTIPVLAIPFLPKEHLENPSLASEYRIPLLNEVQVSLNGEIARKRSVLQGMHYLQTLGNSLAEMAKSDLSAIEEWRSAVYTCKLKYEEAYQLEFLNNAQFQRFDDAKEQLLQLLELPGAGKGLSFTLGLLRWPYLQLRKLIGKIIARPASPMGTETRVIENAWNGWLDELKATAIAKSGQHPIWRHVAQSYSHRFAAESREQFQAVFRHYQFSSAEEIENAARRVCQSLEKRPRVLAGIRAGILLLDVAAIVAAFLLGGFNWPTIIYIVVFVSLIHQIIELFVWQMVESRRRAFHDHKLHLMTAGISHPLSEWLSQWPVTGGSTYEKLHYALKTIPESILQLSQLIDKRSQS
ncbi:MAG: GTPase [Zavarzinella sp.]